MISNLFSRLPLSQHKSVLHVSLPQYKTCTPTTVTIQNMYTYHCHNKTCTRTTVTIENMYKYQCHNTKHVHVPLSQ
jgi:hypothetical protein